jgi:biotin carboxyl carrier protein
MENEIVAPHVAAVSELSVSPAPAVASGQRICVVAAPARPAAGV